MSDEGRRGPFWDMIEGRVAPPAAAVLLGWRLVAIDPGKGNRIGTVQAGILTAMLDDFAARGEP
jgi:hypothetical protein